MARRRVLSRRMVVWLVPILLTVHNAEEAVAFRSYLPRARALLPEPFAGFEASLSYSTLLVALAVLSGLAFLMAWVTATWPTSARAMWALLALEAAVALNVLAHLVSATVLFRGYGPGLVTAVLVNAPFAVYCFRRAWREQWLGVRALLALIPAAVVLHGPLLLSGLWLAGRSSR